jgi:phosphate-selective porin OprO and OprP
MACSIAITSASVAQAQPSPAPADPATAPVAAPPAAAEPTTPAVVSEPPPAAAVVEAPAPTEPVPPSVTVAPAPAVVAPPPAAEEAPVDPLSASAKFKPGKGLDIKSADGNFSLNIKLKGQLQAEISQSDAEGAKLRTYFLVRRMRLALAGALFSKDIKYKLEFSFAGQELGGRPGVNVSNATPATEGTPVTTSFVLAQAPQLDAYLDFTTSRDASVRVGQAKVTYGRERVLSDSDLQTVDRSIDDQEFNFDRDMGVELRSTDFLGLDKLRYYLGIYAAEDRNATLTSSGGGDTGYLYFARVEILPMGSFDDTPVDFARTSPKLSLGFAYAYLQADAISSYATTNAIMATISSGGRPAKVDFGTQNFTADLLFKAGGFSLFSAFHFRKLVNVSDDLPEDAELVGKDGLGVVVQGHYLIGKSPIGIAANFSTITALDDDSGIVERTEAGGGIGYYPFDHGLKVEAEYENIWRESGMPEPDHRVRVQLSFIL